MLLLLLPVPLYVVFENYLPTALGCCVISLQKPFLGRFWEGCMPNLVQNPDLLKTVAGFGEQSC